MDYFNDRFRVTLPTDQELPEPGEDYRSLQVAYDLMRRQQQAVAESLNEAQKRREEEEAARLFTRDDYAKIRRVTEWVNLDNPVLGTCRKCGARDLVDDPTLGLYRYGLDWSPSRANVFYEQGYNLSDVDPSYPHVHRPGDFEKLSQVKSWINVDNPCYGTCRHCGHRGLLDHVCIGAY